MGILTRKMVTSTTSTDETLKLQVETQLESQEEYCRYKCITIGLLIALKFEFNT